MKTRPAHPGAAERPHRPDDLVTELLLLPDGRVLVQNLTPAFAALLRELNPDDEQLAPRTRPATILKP